MKSLNLLHRGGLGGMPPKESEAKWQKHVVIALWMLLVLLVAGAAVLVWAGANGLLGSSDHDRIPSWPVGWP